ncbi:MAG: ATP-binding protein [Promethearchaeota archaeon]|jgi:ferredoxin
MTEIDIDELKEKEVNVYRELQESLDKLPISYPATESGVEIRILKHLFSPEEALIASKLGFNPKSLKEIYTEVEKDGFLLESVEGYLDNMYAKGLIRHASREINEEIVKLYTGAPLVVGFYEFQLGRLTEELVRDVDQYFEEAFIEEANKTGIPQFRTVPIEQAIVIERNIATYDDIRKIIEEAGDLIVINRCICREKHDILGENCIKTNLRETCFSFRSLAEGYQNLGLGRIISKEEALEIIKKVEEDGLVLQPGNSQRPLGICCCCGCCCDILVNQKKFDAPGQFFVGNYFAEVDSDACVGCGTCEQRCNLEAIELIDGISNVNLTRCIGCGVCTSTCPEEAISLVKKQREQLPPKNSYETYKSIAIKRAKLEKQIKR